ncbi:Glycoside hydrolase family 13 protein [Mycena sanguinolenta]|uniref:Glycoside hydrolase family 13 protein n=1 Tax=Mycena sanguinolenta TaxID=230812 RepID=A0A8H6YVF6_9AGAR|nr:Glycoside hydrolase family 13 protein [Mycena sanguinolenta]
MVVASYLDVLDYPTYYNLVAAFVRRPHLFVLFLFVRVYVFVAAFIENHGQPRFPSLTSDIALRKNALVWSFVGDGMPTMYCMYGRSRGYEGGADPANREALWLSAYPNTKPGVATVKTFNSARWITQPDSRTVMLSKPPPLSLFTNESTVQPWWTIPAGLYKPGMTLVDVLACRAVVVGGANTNGASASASASGSGGAGGPRQRAGRDAAGAHPRVDVQPGQRRGVSCAGDWGSER